MFLPFIYRILNIFSRKNIQNIQKEESTAQFKVWRSSDLVLMIFNFSLNCARSQNIKEDIQLKGGLVFKPEGLAQINQYYIQYIRNIDTSALQTFAQQAYSSIQYMGKSGQKFM